MRKIFLFLAATLALVAGCASVPQPLNLEASPVKSTMHAVATLATNACEAETAADYTAVIVARRQAASLLRAKRITVASAVQVQQLADQARAALDKACPGGKPDPAAITSARQARAQIAQVLEGSHAN